MIKKDINVHSVMYETQWPRLMELQERYKHACEIEPSFLTRWFRRDFAARAAAHRKKVNEHFRWFFRQQFGDDVSWVSMYVPRKSFLKSLGRGTGYNGEILQFIFYNRDERH